MKLTKPALITLIVLSFVAIVGLSIAGSYNSLVRSKADVDNSWAQVETQYQRRFDLIGNLVAAVKGSQVQEQKVFSDIANARTKYAGSTNSSDRAAAASQTESALGRLLVVTENYPELKSNENIKSLMAQLNTTEDSIAKARDNYNNVSKNYNVTITSFPRNVSANWFGYHTQQLFKADPTAATAPKVSF